MRDFVGNIPAEINIIVGRLIVMRNEFLFDLGRNASER
jgi:hypothetical protein